MRPDRGAQYRFAVGIRRQGGDGVSHALVNDLNPCIKNGRDDLVLGTEMIVYATRLDPGGLGNFSERNGPVALFAESRAAMSSTPSRPTALRDVSLTLLAVFCAIDLRFASTPN